MARNFMRTIRGRTRSVRQNIWLQINLTLTIIGGSSTVLVVSLNAAGLALRPFTIVRTRMDILIGSDQTVATELFHAALGVIVVSDQASAAGTGSVPAPISNTDAPFFVWQPLLHEFQFGTAVVFLNPAGTRIVVDSKSMRKVGNNEDVAFQVQSATASGGQISIVGRQLIKLH